METSNTLQSNGQKTIIVTQGFSQKNGIGIAGFVMSITGMILCWVPIIRWLLLVPAFLLSFIGLFKSPRALAVIGTIISALIILMIMIIKISFFSDILSLPSAF